MRLKFVEFHKLKSIHYVSFIVTVWALSDALISFYLPIQMQAFLKNLTLFGILFAISSVVGAFSDTILGYLANKIHYITFLLAGLLLSLILVISAVMPFNIILIIWLMVIWGLYYEFVGIGTFSYVSRHHQNKEQSKYFGIIYLFEDLAYVIGPVIGGYMVIFGNFGIYTLCMIFLLLSFIFLPKLAFIHQHKERPILKYKEEIEHFNIIKLFKSYRKVWKYASVFFVAAFLYNVWDSFIWTLIPIQSIGGNPIYAGLITSIFTLPLALLQGYGGNIADKYGRNATFILGLFIASIFTLLFGLQTNIILKILTAGISSLGFAFAYPALMGETSESGQEHSSNLGNLMGVQRIFINIGYILGPVIGGVLASNFGIQKSFEILGVIMMICFVPTIIALIHFEIHGRLHKQIEARFKM